MRIEPITEYMQSQGVGTIGVNLFMHYMPPEIRNGIVVLPSLTGAAINYELERWRKDDGFQVVIRAGSILEGQPMVDNVQDVLTIESVKLLSSTSSTARPMLFTYIRPLHDPIVYPRQLSTQWEMSINFVCAYVIQ